MRSGNRDFYLPTESRGSATFAMCFEILGVRYYLRCKYF